MPHGTADFGATSGGLTTYQVNDMAELAARLGSIDTFDRRGDVFLLEDMEEGAARVAAQWEGTGGAGYLSLVAAKQGRFSYRLVSGSDGDHSASAHLHAALPAVGRVGLELAQSGGSIAGAFELRYDVYTGTRWLEPQIRYDHTTDTLYYMNPASAWVAFATGIQLPVGGGMFNVWKLVVDAEAEEYVRFILNARTFDLKGLAPPVSGATTYPQVYAEMEFTGEPGFNQSAYLDNIILTQNEP